MIYGHLKNNTINDNTKIGINDYFSQYYAYRYYNI